MTNWGKPVETTGTTGFKLTDTFHISLSWVYETAYYQTGTSSMVFHKLSIREKVN
jgi:hypothetical protein